MKRLTAEILRLGDVQRNLANELDEEDPVAVEQYNQIVKTKAKLINGFQKEIGSNLRVSPF